VPLRGDFKGERGVGAAGVVVSVVGVGLPRGGDYGRGIVLECWRAVDDPGLAAVGGDRDRRPSARVVVLDGRGQRGEHVGSGRVVAVAGGEERFVGEDSAALVVVDLPAADNDARVGAGGD